MEGREESHQTERTELAFLACRFHPFDLLLQAFDLGFQFQVAALGFL